MSFNDPIKCSHTRKCGWAGRESELVPVPQEDDPNYRVMTCPRCGHDEYYRISEDDLKKLLAKRSMTKTKTTPPSNESMITQAEAEKLANKAVTDYVNACHCDTMKDVADVLMKLASMCGLAMCAVVGQADAVARMEETAAYIARPEHSVPWKTERAN